jgi:glucose-1-phosphate adenylyltransferase
MLQVIFSSAIRCHSITPFPFMGLHPNIVILAGGASSRMKQRSEASSHLDESLLRLAETRPKSMIGVGGNARPFLDYLLSNISATGYKNVVIVIGQDDTFIEPYYSRGDGSQIIRGMRISYARQPIPPGDKKPAGTADALLRALQSVPEWRGQSFTVCNSDNLYSRTALQILLEDNHSNTLIDYDRSALRFDAERIAQFAVIVKDGDGFLTDIIEKPTHEEIVRSTDARGRIGVSMNIFRFSYDAIFRYLAAVPLHPIRREKELPVAVKMLAADHPRSVFTIPLSEHVIDLTSQSDIPAVSEYLKREFPHF